MANHGKWRIIAVVLGLVLVAPVLAVSGATYFPSQLSVMNPATSSVSSSSTITISSTSSGISSAFAVRPCNCSINLQQIWPMYNTLGAITSASDAVAVANVMSARTVGVNDSPIISGTVGLVPVTIYNITITTILSGGSGLKSGDSQLVTQIGGTFGHTTMNVTGYPALSAGQSWIFFLTLPSKLLESPTPNYYGTASITTGGPQGLFYIQGGNVYSLDNIYPQADSWLQVRAEGVPLTQFASEVQAAEGSNIAFTSPGTGASFTGTQSYTISGTISPTPALPDNVVITVTLQGGSPIPLDEASVAVFAGGVFSYPTSVDIKGGWVTGTYVISVVDSNGATGTTTFEYIAPATTTATVTATTTLPATTTTLTTTQTVTGPTTTVPSTTTATQTITSATMQTSSPVPSWAYATMAALLVVGLAIGYVIKRESITKPQR